MGHLPASLPGGTGALEFRSQLTSWHFPSMLLPGWMASWDQPAVAVGWWPAAHVRLVHTGMLRFAVFPPSLLEYKKKYGEEHGSCQAGIAGFCTEVGASTVGASLPLGSACFLASCVLGQRWRSGFCSRCSRPEWAYCGPHTLGKVI